MAVKGGCKESEGDKNSIKPGSDMMLRRGKGIGWSGSGGRKSFL